jgi:hypothetical protein
VEQSILWKAAPRFANCREFQKRRDSSVRAISQSSAFSTASKEIERLFDVTFEALLPKFEGVVVFEVRTVCTFRLKNGKPVANSFFPYLTEIGVSA